MLDPYLRRTLWLYGSDDARVSFVINASDPLAQRARVGDILDVLAPLGRGVTFEPGAQHILLIGEGTRTTRLVAIAHEAVKLGREVVVLTRGEPFPSHLLLPEIEYRADETLSPELIAWADAIVASGAADFYRGLSDAIRATRYRIEPEFARRLLEMPMPCGIGICYACAADTSRGLKLVCADGPALDLFE
jgi:dihydroorotate dehydrogenase electron transfer subunit